MTRPSITNHSICSVGSLVLGLAGATLGTAQTRLTRPITSPPVAIVPPSTLTAASPLPTRIHLTWPPVTGAVGYKVTATDNAGYPESTLYEGAAGTFAVDPGMCAGGMVCQYIQTNVWDDRLWSYRVYSIFGGSPPIYSAPGPVASARMVPFAAPTNLRATIAPSTVAPGRLRATLTWDAVANAVGYSVVDVTATRGFVNPVSVSGTSLVLDGRESLPARQRSSICVSVLYPFGIRKESVRSCVTVGP